jgi:hypothetical protein
VDGKHASGDGAHETQWQKNDRGNERERSMYRDAHQSKRQQKEPDEWITDQRNQRERPTDNE